MFDLGGTPHSIALTLVTNAFVVVGKIETRQRRITDLFNQDEEGLVILTDVTFDELGPAGQTYKAEFAQVNLASVLFAVTREAIEAPPELRTNKQHELALLSVPPFKVIGTIHVLPERSLREALSELTGAFIPVTNATYWSDTLGEPRTQAETIVVNHRLAQILAPHQEVDPWAGVSMAGSEAGAEEHPAPPTPTTEPTGWE